MRSSSDLDWKLCDSLVRLDLIWYSADGWMGDVIHLDPSQKEMHFVLRCKYCTNCVETTLGLVTASRFSASGLILKLFTTY
jgi:hypothetical protein